MKTRLDVILETVQSIMEVGPAQARKGSKKSGRRRKQSTGEKYTRATAPRPAPGGRDQAQPPSNARISLDDVALAQSMGVPNTGSAAVINRGLIPAAADLAKSGEWQAPAGLPAWQPIKRK